MEHDVLVKVEDLRKWFDLSSSIVESLLSREERFVKAVDGITFDIRRGEIFGLVGESGCGKTTTGRLIMGATEPTSGRVLFDGVDLSTIKEREEIKNLALKRQMIFQDPYEYLSPWLTVEKTLAEPLRIHDLTSSEEEEREKVLEIMETVDLTPTEMLLPKYAYELSGGQRQRVVIARALLLNPTFIVADEPVSMLDVSIRIGILNLLLEMKRKFSITSLFITHDIAVSRYMCDRIGVMYLGKIVERGPTETIINEPLHPYTQALLSAVPVPDPKIGRSEIPIKGRIPTSSYNFPGCRFAPRCPFAEDYCSEHESELVEVAKDHFVACPRAQSAA
jgi:peptide/nickel transport system ATP-binding protein